MAASIAVSTASALDELTLDYSHDQFPNACAMRICMRGCRVCGLFGNLELFFFDGMGGIVSSLLLRFVDIPDWVVALCFVLGNKISCVEYLYMHGWIYTM